MHGISNIRLKSSWNDWHHKRALMGSSHTMTSLTEQEISTLSKILPHSNSQQVLTCYQHLLYTRVTSPIHNLKMRMCFIAI